MKKIYCEIDNEDYVKVKVGEDFATLIIGVSDKNCEFETGGAGIDAGIYLWPDKIRKLRKQLKKALLKIEGVKEKTENKIDDSDWFTPGKAVVITGYNTGFPVGEIVVVVVSESGLNDEYSKKCEYLDGRDYFYVKPSDCKPYKEDEA